MNLAELFLREHGSVHTFAVAQHPFSIDHLLKGLTDEEARARPLGMNSLAWLFWHMARVEDGCFGCLVAGSQQVLDEGGWAKRLGVSQPSIGTGMTKAEVADLSEQIDLAALWAYRNAVGIRTRSLVQELWPERWTETVTADDIHRAAAAGIFRGATSHMSGMQREWLLFWWGLNHSNVHLGQATLIKNLVKQGS